MRKLKYTLGVILIISPICFVQGQSKGIIEINKALEENQPERAEKILHSFTDKYISEKNADSLVKYIFYSGKVERAKSNVKAAEIKMLSLVNKIKNFTSNPATLRQACIEAGEFYGSAGMNKPGYKMNQEALKYTILIPGKTGNLKAATENNLSTFAQRMGDIHIAKKHARNSLNYLLSEANPDFETLYISYNGMGSLMWYSSKTDSALYFYKLALETLAKMERSPRNSFYRPSIVLNNLSALYQLEGKTTQAIKAMESTIDNLKKYVDTDEPDYKKTSAVTFQLEAYDNLGSIYKEIGDLNKAKNLLEFSYSQKQKLLSPDDPGIFISQIILGQLYFAMRNYEKAIQFLNNGLNRIAESGANYLSWQGDAASTLALIYKAKKDIKLSSYFYERADSLYEEAFQGEYDNTYLDFLRDAAHFYAENGQPQVGEKKALKGYDYVVKTQGAKTLMAFNQLLNLAQVNYLSGQYTKALNYSKESLVVVDNIIRTSDNLLDSVRMELKKPLAVLQKSKAEYQLLKTKDAARLTPMLEELNKALLLLERQKTILNDPRDISILMAENTELVEFIKKITLELFNTTQNPMYIDRLVNLHESGIYNRIRSRLDKNDSLQFAHIPPGTLLKEKTLKLSLTNALKGTGTHDQKMQQYLGAIEAWNAYQEKIRKDYPQYYQMRYSSIFKSTDKIEKSIPANTTLIRYFFIEKDLYALVADNNQKQLFSLGNQDLKPGIAYLSGYKMEEAKAMEMAFALYQRLWAPLTNKIYHKKIIIIPDGILFNLNFEILTPKKISHFKELASKSLISDFTISYNYSLFLLNAQKEPSSFKNNFVAFAPGFSDKIKKDYQQGFTDPLKMDRGYLSLLPQPFSIGLVTRIERILGGKTYINEHSTKHSFRQNAGNSRIIHIGTHAESNNEYPEYSKLIFAKNISTGMEDNALYVDEIYNYDLRSELTVLTACESGKPGYQDGEGMISLAHAFNYAGSESILTGLWEIDEQASAILLDNFYENLLKGMDKDEALRAAKLTYLETADGRMLSPQYWAGLVIVGDTSPVDIKKNHAGKKGLILGVLTAVLLGGFVLWMIRRRPDTRE
ncbi:MAG: CHAT domain-containing tetratricopeptide repeat protein [Ginsengibacter sp.]